MNIQQNMSLMEKLSILTAAAKYDVACTSSGVDRRGNGTGMGNSLAAESVTHSLRMGAVFLCSRSSLPMNVFLTAPTARTTVTPM